MLFICSFGIQDNGIWNIVYFTKFEKLRLRIMVFKILEFHKNVHFKIMGFGLLSSEKSIFKNWNLGNHPIRYADIQNYILYKKYNDIMC
jgi:hypothetical protein